jgi:site-specific recombinase XerD
MWSVTRRPRSARAGAGDDRTPVVHVAGLYRYAAEEDLLDHSPAAHVRRPRLDYESHATALDHNEIGALLVAAGLGTAAEHALISLLTLNGLCIFEALGADIEALGVERGHRTLTVLRKGGKIVTIPLAPAPSGRSVGERVEGPIFRRADGQRMDRHAVGRIVHRTARKGGLGGRKISPHTLRHAFITAALDAGVPLRDVQEAASHDDPRTTMRHHRAPGLAGPARHLRRRRLPGRRHPLTDRLWSACRTDPVGRPALEAVARGAPVVADHSGWYAQRRWTSC